MTAGTYTLPELAERLGCSSWLVYDLHKKGELPFPVLKLGRKLLVSRAYVDSILGPPEHPPARLHLVDELDQ